LIAAMVRRPAAIGEGNTHLGQHGDELWAVAALPGGGQLLELPPDELLDDALPPDAFGLTAGVGSGSGK
jgi:hypothetical protein